MPDLRSLYLGQSTLGISVDRFGTEFGGGINMVFSDVLGDHLFAVAAQLNGGLDELGGQVLYQNRDHRLNWGVAAGHMVYQTGRMYSEARSEGRVGFDPPS
jgi:hypothetical protein